MGVALGGAARIPLKHLSKETLVGNLDQQKSRHCTGCGARQIRLLYPIPFQINEDLSSLEKIKRYWVSFFFSLSTLNEFRILSKSCFRNFLMIFSCFFFLFFSGWINNTSTVSKCSPKDLNMPLWKDIEVKAAKLGVTVEQGWGLVLAFRLGWKTQCGPTFPTWEIPDFWSFRVISDRIRWQLWSKSDCGFEVRSFSYLLYTILFLQGYRVSNFNPQKRSAFWWAKGISTPKKGLLFGGYITGWPDS